MENVARLSFHVKALIFLIVTYTAETWTIKMEDRRKTKAFEMWAYRTMLTVLWTEHQTNVNIL